MFRVGEPGAAGLNVTSLPLRVTAVHWLTDGHATATGWLRPAAMMVADAVPGTDGLNVTCIPSTSSPTAVHWLTDGHATPRRGLPAAIVAGTGVPGADGSNVTARPEVSTAVHWLADGHATPSRFCG